MNIRTMPFLIGLCSLLVIGAIAAAGVARAAPRSPAVKTPVVGVETKHLPENVKSTVFDIALNHARSITLPVAVRDIIIANPDIADIIVKKPNLIFVIARAAGSTTVYFLDQGGDIILKSEVRVHIDTGAIQAALNDLIPGGAIKASAYRDGLFLTGTARNADEAANAREIVSRFAPAGTSIVNMLKMRSEQQVMLQVRVAEVARTVRKNLAISQPLSTGFADLAVAAIDPFNTINFFASGGFNIGKIGPFDFGPATFRALEENGLVKTLAEPALTAISGETANFLAGGEFPFPAGFDENGNTIIEFRNFGIGLNFTPVVMDGGRINLHISTEISNISNANGLTLQGFFIPGIATRRTETTVDLPSGGTIMLAGLLQQDGTNTITGTPYLKDVPVLGALFRSTQFSQNHTELLIIITASLVKSNNASGDFALPTDGFPPASDVDLYLLGRLHGEYLKSGAPDAIMPLAGPFGYIME